MTRRKGTAVYRRLAVLAGGTAFFLATALPLPAGLTAFFAAAALAATGFFAIGTAFLAGAAAAGAGALAVFFAATGLAATGLAPAGLGGGAAFSLGRPSPFTATLGALLRGSGDPLGRPGPVFCTSVN